MNPLKFVRQLGESALSIVGVRTVEEPHYISRPVTDRVEIRQYGSRIAAETTVPGERQKALNTGFRRLAGYIFGGNQRDTEIAMTAPVSQAARNGDSEEIAMTAPVSQAGNADDGWTVRFFMPSKWSMETLPKPDDENVRLVTVPPQTVAVLTFSGDRSAAAVAARSKELLAMLRDNGIEPKGETTAWFYDPPWTLPFRRRSEVVVTI
ncbi:MAG: heme-binding protein [Actinomycetota bacterium]